MTPNQIKDKAKAICEATPGMEDAARDAWSRIWNASQKTMRGKTRSKLARLALLQVIVSGGTIEAAEQAALEALQ